SGPIGQVLNPLLLGLDKNQDLLRACTGCGRCREVCPAGLDHPQILQFYRQKDVEGDPTFQTRKRPWQERQFFKFWGWAVKDRNHWNSAIGVMRPFLNYSIDHSLFRSWIKPLHNWLDSRNLPPVSGKMFHERWQSLKADEPE
ncbi:DUF3390 domain-containing protein, partial [bacterium]|nr:DUF3390 domain-containing protein [bacterium]